MSDMGHSAEKDAGALDARCSQCGQPFRNHKTHLDPTERGGFRASMTCPTPEKHRHDYQRVGYGGAGWSLFRCACGAEEIDA